MNKFTEKAIQKELIEMGLIKAILDTEESLVDDESFYLMYAYKGLVYGEYAFLNESYKETSPEDFIKSIKEEIDLAKKEIRSFKKANKRFKKTGEYDEDKVVDYIRTQVDWLSAVTGRGMDREYFNKKYISKIKKKLRRKMAPMKIYKSVLRDYGMLIKPSKEGYEIVGQIEYDEARVNKN